MSEPKNTTASDLTEQIMLALFSSFNPPGKALVLEAPSYVYNPAYSAVLAILEGTYNEPRHPESAQRYLERFQHALVYPELRDFVHQVIKERDAFAAAELRAVLEVFDRIPSENTVMSARGHINKRITELEGK